MTVLLMNPNANRATTEAMCRMSAGVLHKAPRGWTAPAGPQVITTPEALADAAALVESAAIDVVPDAIIVAAFGDPGAAILARRLPCPVIGIGAASARAAARGDAPFAVVTTTPLLAAPIDALMKVIGGSHYIGTVVTPGEPRALMADPEALDAALLAAVHRAVDAGAAGVVIGGGPLGQAAERLCARSPAPLYTPVICAAREVAAILKASRD